MSNELKRVYFFGLPVFAKSKKEIISLVEKMQELSQAKVDSHFINRETNDTALIGLLFASKEERNKFKQSQAARDYYVDTMQAAAHKTHLSASLTQAASTLQ